MRSFLLCLSLLAAGCSAASASPTQSPASASATFTRSSVAGTWNVSVVSTANNYTYTFALQLHGPDEALTGGSTWTGGAVTGDFASGTLHLTVFPSPSGNGSSSLFDCTVSSDGQTCTGHTVGGVLTGPLTMTRG